MCMLIWVNSDVNIDVKFQNIIFMLYQIRKQLNINVRYCLKYFVNELYLIIIDNPLSTISNTSLC